MHKLRFGFGRRPIPHVRSTCLKVRKGAGARDLQPGTHARSPYLDVVRPRACEARVSSRQLDNTIWKLQPLKNSLRVRGNALVLRRGVLRANDPHQLYLIELMDPNEAAGVLTTRKCLAPETRCIRDIAQRQHLGIQDLVTVNVGDRNLSRWDKKQVIRDADVYLLGKLRQLTSARQSGTVHQVRRRDLQVAVLASVQIQHEARQGTTDLCAHPGEQREPGA